MRLAALVFLVACGPSAPAAVTVHEAPAADLERQAAATLAKMGRLERAVQAFTVLDVKKPETQAQTFAVEIDALAALFRCDEVRDLAAIIDARGDAEAKTAARGAREECGRVAMTPSESDERRMREAFGRDDYAAAWAIAPSLAALLGIARAAKARGDAALAERSYERALAYSERSDEKVRVAIGPVGAQSDPAPSVLDVGDTSALAAFESLVVSQDLKTGALRVVASVPKPWAIWAGHGDRLIIARDGHASLMRIGIDEPRTSTPIDLGTGPGEHRTVFSADGALVARVSGASAWVADVRTGRTLAHTGLGSPEADVIGFTDAHALVVGDQAGICTMAAPDWACVSSKDLARDSMRPATLAGHVLAFQPSANAFVVFDLDKKKILTTLQGHFQLVTDLVLSPNASKLVSVSERRTVVWDLATKKRDDMLFTSTKPWFTPDGATFVEAAMNALLVRAFATFPATSAPLAVGAFPLSTPLPEISFAPDGKLVVHATFDTVRIDLAARTTQWIGHNYETSGPLLASMRSPDAKWSASFEAGAVTANGTTIEVGPDAAVFTDASGHVHVSGNEASARCVVGDDWLPLDACRDRLLR